MKKLLVAVPALALAAGLSLTACGSTKAPAAAPAVTHTVTAPAAAPKPTTPAPTSPASTTPAPAKTVIVQPAPAKTVYVAPAAQPAAPALTDCGGYLYVNADTSCSFAQNVEANYTGLGPDYAYSPVTGENYTMNCVAGYGNLNGGDSVVCTGGDNALVEWGAN